MIDHQQLIEQTGFFNDDQKEAVFCDANCVVTAGAGSGKTSVLTYRFFRLVAQMKADVDQILTLTFTKAAANEMYERIYALLSSFKDDSDIAVQMEKFRNATISTIDSFCYQVVQADVTRFGLSPSFSLDNDLSEELAVECAYNILQKYPDDRAVGFLSSVYSPKQLVEDVFAAVATRYFYPGDSFDPDSVACEIIEYIRSYTASLASKMEQIVRQLTSYDDTSKTYKENEEKLNNILPLVRDIPSLLSRYEQVLPPIGTVKKLRAKSPHKEQYNESVEILRGEMVSQLSFCCRVLSDSDMINAIYKLLGLYRDLYLEKKREREVVTYNDVAQMACVILRENENVRRYFSNAYRYIMVDEFQDTNALQKEILYLLSSESPVKDNQPVSVHSLKKDKLFFVGDEKQSIYRFRGADVRVFRQLHKEILSAGGRHITLHTNYRSERHLIRLFNSLFERIFSMREYDFEAEFSPLRPKEEEGENQKCSSSSLVILPDIESKDDDELFESAAESEAYYIAQKIEQMVGSDDYLIRKGDSLSRPSYDDIAILLRTTSPQMHYEKALRQKGIPYQLSSVKSLFLEAVMNDIYLLLQLLIYSDDFLSYAALLRSPFCNVDDITVIEAVKRAETDKALFTLDTFENESMQERYETLAALYQTLMVKSGQESIASLLYHLWYEGGYRVHLLSDSSYSVYLEHFEYLVEVALDIERKGGSLITFLDFLRERMGNAEKVEDIEVLGENEGGVNIMTVHKSKGLEFPIVIVANAGGKGRSLMTPAVHYWEDDRRRIPVVHHFEDEGRGKNLLFEIDRKMIEKSDSAELKRLLYVAFTRAKNHLLITGCDNGVSLGQQYMEKNFLSMIYYNSAPMSEYENKEGQLFIDEVPQSTGQPSQQMIQRSEIIKKALEHDVWYKEAEPAIIYRERFKSVTAYEKEVQSGHPSDVGLQLPSLECDDILRSYHIENNFGTWTHAMFEYVFSELAGAYKTVDFAEYEQRMPRELNSLALREYEKRTMILSIEKMLSSFFESDFYRSLHTEDLVKMDSELPFAVRMNTDGETVVLNGVIDLLVRYEQHLVVVDFKTDAYLDVSAHAKQLKIYSEAVKKIFGKDVSSALVYLREKECVRWL